MNEDLLKRLDERHEVMKTVYGKDKPTLYSEAAAEIRRLEALLAANANRDVTT